MKKITIGILTYNHSKFIKDCLRSVLRSSFENLQIIISDDASKDNTVGMVKEVLENTVTNHEVIFNINQENLGLAGNFNKTFGELANGDFLITLGGDDILKGDYFEEALQFFLNDTNLMMLDFNADIINEDGHITKKAKDLGYEIKFSNLENYLNLKPIPSFAPGRMIRNNLVKKFAPIFPSCPTEDSVLVLRALMLGKHGRLNKSYIMYRRHSENISSVDNLMSISNGLIISQYLNDLTHLFWSKYISDEILMRLLKRINYEHKKRELFYSNLSLIYKRIKHHSMKFQYKFFN